MNKAISTSFAILCLLFVLPLIGCRISVKANPDVIHVPTDHPTIQEAINNASSGDMIFVQNGTYYEHIVVNKSVSLVGEDKAFTIIDGNGTDNVISITASNVSIHDFTLRNSGLGPEYSGIFIDRSTGNNISHNIILNANDGIRLQYSTNNLISGNTLYLNYYNGVVLYSSSNNVVSGNIIYSNYHGIYLDFYSSNNTIYCNNFNNTYQVWSYSTNAWSCGGQGNYWSDYPGQDLDGDGIGDTPYFIDLDNQDNHPLMGMFSDFDIVFEREIHSVAIISNSTISNFRFEITVETGNRIIGFNATGEEDTVGFCRVTIPTELMKYPYYPYIVLIGSEEINATLLDISNETHVYLYFTYFHENHTITIISRAFYNELLDKYLNLQMDLNNLNATYYELLNDYLNLQMDLNNLNATYYELLNDYNILFGNYSDLQKSLDELNNSYQEHLLDYSEQMQNIRSLMYIFAATTAIFIIATIYLSKYAHTSITTRPR